MDAPFLYNEVLGNPVLAWLEAAGVFLALLGAGALLKALVRTHLARSAQRTDFDQALGDALTSVRLRELAVAAVYLASRSLVLSGGVERTLYLVFLVVVSVRTALLIQRLLAFLWRRATVSVHEGDPTVRSALRNVEYVLSVGVWLAAGLFILENLGVNITTAVAGLGIGGIAVAMAAQQILGDLFSSFVIFLDKPFRVGDFIIVDDHKGTVENIGIKTTQVRSLSGEMLVFSNSDLTKSRIRNFKRMSERRVALSFGISHDTPLAKAEAVPAMVKESFAGVPRARFERAHLKGFGPAAIEYEAVYHVLSDDYGVYMDVQQQASLALLKRFEKEGVAIAVAETAIHVTASS